MSVAKAAWRGELAALFPDARFDEPMSRHTTFRIGGPADALVSAGSAARLAELYRFARARALEVFPLGFGSNLLVRDGGLRAVVVQLTGEFEAVRFEGERSVWAGAGVRLPQLVLQCAERGLAGSEPLVGVPGTVGGALVMNAGTRDGEIGDLVRAVDVLDPESLRPLRLPKEKLSFSYRHSSLGGTLVLGGLLELKAGDKVVILSRVRDFQSRRLKTQPVHSFNVGSVFKNPPGRFVARLIQEAGLKGRAVGGARVSPKHANFIENHAGASARDVLALVEKIREAVRARAGIELELEMQVVGDA